MEIISKNEKETQNIAHQIANLAKSGDVYALVGDLGAGKTTFAQGFVKSFGINDPVTSPTFVIEKRYSTLRDDIKELIHIDCYRLSGEDDAHSIGLSETLARKDSIILIEWPEKVQAFLPKKTKLIVLKYIDENKRLINADFIN